jgi:carbon-monoxide dehydrogenase medium subunit
MKPAPFEYHAPSRLDDAVALLARLGEGAKVIAGGQSLVPMLALRLAVFDDLVDIGGIDELRGVERRNGSLWIGAGTTQSTIGSSDDVRDAVPLLARATPLIGHFQIRNRGTLGGSLAHADPAAEYPAVALTLDAQLVARSPRGERTIAVRDFFTGTWSTDLADDEILTGANFPVAEGRAGFAIEELARRHGDFALAGATVAVTLDDADRIARAAIGLLGLGSTPRRAAAAESLVTGAAVTDVDAAAVGRAAVADLVAIPSDLHAPASYRTRVGAVIVARAWERAIEEARQGPVPAGTGR